MTEKTIEIAKKFKINLDIPVREDLVISVIPKDFISIIPYAELIAVYDQKEREVFFEKLDKAFIGEVKKVVKSINKDEAFANWISNESTWNTDDAKTLSTLYYIGLVHDLFESGGLVM